MQSARCQFECEAAMSQLSTAVGNAALMIPVVIAVVGSLRSSSTPSVHRSSKGRGKGAARAGAKGGAGFAGFGGARGGGAELQWIKSPLGRLVQGCVQVDFRHVTDEDELMAKANQLRRALFRAMAAGSQLTQLLPALASPSSSPSKHSAKTKRLAPQSSLVAAPATPASVRLEGVEGWLRLDKARGGTAARLYRVKTDTDIYGDNPHGEVCVCVCVIHHIICITHTHTHTHTHTSICITHAHTQTHTHTNTHTQGLQRISLFQDDVVTLLSVELEAVVIKDYVPPVEQRNTRMFLKEKEVECVLLL